MFSLLVIHIGVFSLRSLTQMSDPLLSRSNASPRLVLPQHNSTHCTFLAKSSNNNTSLRASTSIYTNPLDRLFLLYLLVLSYPFTCVILPTCHTMQLNPNSTSKLDDQLQTRYSPKTQTLSSWKAKLFLTSLQEIVFLVAQQKHQ